MRKKKMPQQPLGVCKKAATNKQHDTKTICGLMGQSGGAVVTLGGNTVSL